MLLFVLVLVLLQHGSYSGVQGQQPTSATATNSLELQRLTEEVAQVKESIKELRNILLGFKDELALEVKQSVQNEVASLNNTIASLICKDDDEILTCNPPTITHLEFTHDPISSTLTCISTGSPATTVTWMKDGQPLDIDGSTYFLTHTATYGRSTTYENVLTINAAVSSIYRHPYTCTVVNALGSDSKTLTASPPPIVNISPPGGTPNAGEHFSFTCSITLEDGGSLTEDVIVQWEAPVDIMDSEIQVVTADSTVARTSALQFTPVRTSHGGQYACKATTTAGTAMATETLTVQIPPPTLTVSRDPGVGVILRHRDNLTLTCSIQLDPAVDSDVVVTGRLQGQAGGSSTTVTTSDGVYRITLYILSLLATPSDTYTCTATVEPGSGVMFIQHSESHYSLNITVELFVDIMVSYTPPPGFIPGPNEYRAASGPVTVTCTAVGGSGPVSYQWSSTCRDCPFLTGYIYSSSVTRRAAVHSGDTGIHTCTATTVSNIHGSRSINFNVVGAGIHVFIGFPTGSFPNNGMVILNTDRCNSYWRPCFRFFCRSDSMLSNVGMLNGPDGTTVTTGDVFEIQHPQPGELHVYIDREHINLLTASDQGVYTCCIPLQSGENKSINIGLYLSGFNTPPSITHLGFIHGPISSTLTCISTGSPATTVTWIRDGQPLIIDGNLYQSTQTVTNRRLSTYENVLNINAAVSNIYRHTYTCTVANVLGRNSKTVIASPLPRVAISTTGKLTAGEPFFLTCSVTLEDGGSLTKDLTVQWERPLDISMDSDIEVITNNVSTVAHISILSFTLVRTSHGGEYTCKATTTAGTDTATEILNLEIPPPTLAISRVPANVTLHPGDYLGLTCTIWLDPAVVDIDVVVTGRLGGPGGNSTTMTASAGMYRLILDIPFLRATSSGTYTCTVTVVPGSRSTYVNGSESQSNLDITVE